MIYLYIDEEGNVRQSTEQPTNEDILNVEDGRLDIVKVDDDGKVELLLDNEYYTDVPDAITHEGPNGPYHS